MHIVGLGDHTRSAEPYIYKCATQKTDAEPRWLGII